MSTFAGKLQMYLMKQLTLLQLARRRRQVASVASQKESQPTAARQPAGQLIIVQYKTNAKKEAARQALARGAALAGGVFARRKHFEIDVRRILIADHCAMNPDGLDGVHYNRT